MDKARGHVVKTALISSLVSTNILIWYEILGIKFLIAIIILSMIITLASNTKNVWLQ